MFNFSKIKKIKKIKTQLKKKMRMLHSHQSMQPTNESAILAEALLRKNEERLNRLYAIKKSSNGSIYSYAQSIIDARQICNDAKSRGVQCYISIP